MDTLNVNRFILEEVASIIGTTPHGLREMHKHGRGPVMYILGKRLVCDEPDLVAWVESQKAKSARGEGAGNYLVVDGAA